MNTQALPYTNFITTPDGCLKGMPSLEHCTHAVVFKNQHIKTSSWNVWSVEINKEKAEEVKAILLDTCPKATVEIVECQCKEIPWEIK